MKALSIHLTDICNSKCSFCIVDSPYIKQDTIMRRRVSRFLSEHAGQGYEGVSLHGGEATIRRDFLEILDEIREKGYPTVHLMTNARKLARMAFARSVVEKGVSLFIVSMHGATAPTQDKISGSPGSFDQAVQGIRNVKELGASVRTNSVVCKDNYTELPDIIDLCLDLGADQVNLSALHTDRPSRCPAAHGGLPVLHGARVRAVPGRLGAQQVQGSLPQLRHGRLRGPHG
jgi:MoaA/NifB/PqqE/SkfB family radical SAM enzyme